MTAVSNAVAVVSGPELDEVAEQIRQLRLARDWARSCSENEALDARRQAALVREWVRINKASKEIAIEACKLHATALRRLAQLGSRSITGQERTASLWLADRSDDEFAQLLANMTYPRTPVSMHHEWLKQQETKIAVSRGQDIGRGYGEPDGYESVAKAANELLHAAQLGGAVTVNELTEELVDHLHIRYVAQESSERFWLLRSGVESIVREALRSNEFEDSQGRPEFITWKDKEAGWLRIPWSAATISQLEWMAEYRQQQAKELVAVADDLSSLAAKLRSLAAVNPGAERLSDLWNLLPATV